MENKQQAIEARNELVREWDEAKKHLRQIREDQFNGIGSGMNAEDWKEWDSVDAFYNEAVGKIDHVIFMNGWMA